jgi:transcriptional regulator with XRE-family HTH domain
MARRSIEDTQALTEAVSALLQSSNKTNQELSEIMGVSPQYISNYVHGRKPVSLSMLIKIRRHLKVDINRLLDRCSASLKLHSKVNNGGKI